MPEHLEATVDKFVFRVAADCLYSPEGIWVQPQDGGARVGLTDFLQQRSGDVAFVHVKPLGSKLTRGEELGEIETIKADQSLFSPLSGVLVEINSALERTPELINQDPYEKGWVAVIEAADWEATL